MVISALSPSISPSVIPSHPICLACLLLPNIPVIDLSYYLLQIVIEHRIACWVRSANTMSLPPRITPDTLRGPVARPCVPHGPQKSKPCQAFTSHSQPEPERFHETDSSSAYLQDVRAVETNSGHTSEANNEIDGPVDTYRLRIHE